MAAKRGQPGHPKAGGRQAGTGNKADFPTIKSLSELSREGIVERIRELHRLALGAESEQTRVAAIKELNDRGYGRPQQTVNVRRITSVQDLTDEELEVLASEGERQHFPLKDDVTRH